MEDSLDEREYGRRGFTVGSSTKKPGIGALISIVFVWAVIAVGVQDAAAIDDLVVYDDALASGWGDWSYSGVTVNDAGADPVYAGTRAIAVTYTGGWSGFQIGFGGADLDVNAYDVFRFYIHGGASGGQSVSLRISIGGYAITQAVTPQAGAWTLVEASLSGHSPRTVYSIDWFNNSPGAQPSFFLDNIVFADSGAAPAPQPPPGVGPDLSVDAAADAHPISPYIYGMNFAAEDVASAVRLPVRRWGGNSTTRYNWEIDVHNSGSDWYYENIPDAPGRIDDIVDQDRRTETETILTMPLIGWTPKRRLEGHPYDCGFKISEYGPQDSADPWDADCGNGMQSAAPISGNDPADTSEAITAAFVSDWIDDLTTTHGAAGDGGVKFYSLDNEPMLWNSTHRDVHPEAATYDEIRAASYAYGAAIKAADPASKTLGPVTWGWCAWFYSAADECRPGSDHGAHGDMDFTEWYLDQMRAYEQANGVRILDYLDLHIYPQVNGVYSESRGDAGVQAARLRSTRQLWDDAYVHEGWIAQPVYLIPRMKQWVADHYPGTGLAITEYNWGALGYMNGALAQADLLGIFGREGLDLATLWGPPDLEDPGTFAFLMYRDYDGAGGSFGDTSISASSADQETAAIYAAIRGDDGALTLMIINKTDEDQISPVSLSNFSPATWAEVYRYSGADLSAIVHLSDISVAGDGFTADLPANSITLFVIPHGARVESDQTGLWASPSTWVGDVVPGVDAAVAITNDDIVTATDDERSLQVTVDSGATLVISQPGSLTLMDG